MSKYIKIALQKDVLNTALKISFTVGTVLALINHSPALFSLSLTKLNAFQIILTYLVPYGVSTYSSVKAIVNQSK